MLNDCNYMRKISYPNLQTSENIWNILFTFFETLDSRTG